MATHCLVSSVKSKLKARSLRSSVLTLEPLVRAQEPLLGLLPAGALLLPRLRPRRAAAAVHPEQLLELVLEPRRPPDDLAGAREHRQRQPRAQHPDGTCDAIDDARAPVVSRSPPSVGRPVYLLPRSTRHGGPLDGERRCAREAGRSAGGYIPNDN